MTMRILMLLFACAALSGAALAQGEKPGEPSHEEMMKVFEEMARPGPEHAMLGETAGRWNCQVKSWHDPKGDPEVSEGTDESEAIFGGRYIRSHFKGAMMGQPYEGLGVMGFDKGKKKFVGTWFDSMGTGILTYEGDYDAGKKELICRGSYTNPMTGTEDHCRLVTRFENPDRHVFEFWGPNPEGGVESRWMEITYNRIK